MDNSEDSTYIFYTLVIYEIHMFWEREEEAGREVGATMVIRSELRCGEDDATLSSRNVDKGCVGVIGVDDSCVDVVVVVMRLGVKCEMAR